MGGSLPQTKDNVIFSVLSLDMQTRLTTTVLQIENLPYDLEKNHCAPSPLNGSLLIGCNELLHVDTGGITRRIAVNQYTRRHNRFAQKLRRPNKLRLEVGGLLYIAHSQR